MKPTDLIDRIATEHSLTRSQARRVLIDLVDHHKRLKLTRGLKYRPPVSTTTTDAFTNYRHTPYVSDEIHPYSRSQQFVDSSKDEISSLIPQPIKIKKTYSFLFVELPDGSVLKRCDYVDGLLIEGFTVVEIIEKLLPLCSVNPDETAVEHFRRIRSQVNVRNRIHRRRNTPE